VPDKLPTVKKQTKAAAAVKTSNSTKKVKRNGRTERTKSVGIKSERTKS
jgi:hypothetical protein